MSEKFKRLTLDERKTIECLLHKGMSCSDIAKSMDRGKNVVVSEVRKSGGKENYNAEKAQLESDLRKERKFTSTSGDSQLESHISRVRLLHGEGKSFWQIRKEIGINHILLNKIFNKLEIKNIHTYDMIDSLEKRLDAIEIALSIVMNHFNLK